MEDFPVLLVQLAIEVVFDLPSTCPSTCRSVGTPSPGGREGCGWLALYVVLGGAAGGLSLLFRPGLMLPSPALRMANLAVAPVAAGAVSWGLAAWRRSRGATVDPTTHLWTAVAFVLAFGTVRLGYGIR